MVHSFPALLIFVFAIGANVAWLCVKFPNFLFVISISMLVTFSSIIMYSKDSNGVTITFMVSLLTIFTIDWEQNPGYRVIFVMMYTSYLVISGLVASIKVASQQESILIQASGYMSVDKAELKKLVSESKASNLSILEKSEIVRYLAIRNLDKEEIKSAIPEINLIKLAFQLDSKSSSKYYYTIYQTVKLKSDRDINKQVRQILDMIFEFPLEPSDVFDLISSIKSNLIKSKKSSVKFLKEVNELLSEGKEKDEIVKITSTF